ncbi:MAG: hypothetical protein IEMM0003_0758 [bacterium]|nr:MAG: hypothetical protein IEMM0003_0758 [bacterium]
MLLFIAAAAAIIVIVLIALGYPLFYGKLKEVPVETYMNRRLDELLSRKEALYSAIKELDFDFKTNKLSEEDYKELKERYRRDALLILKEIDEVREGKSMDNIMEKEVLARRKPHSLSGEIGEREKLENSEDADGFIEKEILARRKSLSFCPHCGFKCDKSSKFCSQCGRELK